MIASLLHPSSYFGIIFFLILTGCGLPVPEEVAIVIAGVLSAQGKLNVWLALASCLVGAIIGDCVMYSIGHRWGHSLIYRHPRVAKLMHVEREKAFEQALERHAFKVMLLARFMMGVRGPVYLAAGVVRMPFRRFLMYDIVCATLVVGTFFGLAYLFGNGVYEWIHHAELTFTLVVALILTAVGIFLYYRHGATIYQALFGTEPSDH